MKQRQVFGYICALAFVVLATGCAKYTFLEATAERVSKSRGIAVSVWSYNETNPGPVALEGYLTAALVGKGFTVRSIAIELLAGRTLLERILPGFDHPSGESSLMKLTLKGSAGQKNDGKGFGVDDLAKAEERLVALAKLARRVPVEWNVDYLLSVHHFDAFSYAVYVVRLTDNKVIHMTVVSGNRQGFAKVLQDPGFGYSYEAEDGDVTRMQMLRLATHVATQI